MSNLTLGASFLFNTDIKLNEIVDTGATWMGKKVYAKLVEGTYSSTSGTTVNVPHGISIDTYGYFIFLDFIGCGSDNVPYYYPINYYSGSSYAYCGGNRTNLRISTNESKLLGRNVKILIIFAEGD